MPTGSFPNSLHRRRDHLFRHRQAFQPGRHVAVEMDARPAPEAQVVRMAGKIEGALAAQVHVVAHEPLQRDEDDFPGRPTHRDVFRQRTAIDPAHHPLKPSPSDVAVDGLGVDTTGFEPWRIDHEAGRDRVEQRL